MSTLKEIIRNKPYYICRRKGCERNELRSSIGGEILKDYGQTEDQENDEYLEQAIEAYIAEQVIKELEELKGLTRIYLSSPVPQYKELAVDPQTIQDRIDHLSKKGDNHNEVH
jgi:hypothetical protein